MGPRSYNFPAAATINREDVMALRDIEKVVNALKFPSLKRAISPSHPLRHMSSIMKGAEATWEAYRNASTFHLKNNG